MRHGFHNDLVGGIFLRVSVQETVGFLYSSFLLALLLWWCMCTCSRCCCYSWYCYCCCGCCSFLLPVATHGNVMEPNGDHLWTYGLVVGVDGCWWLLMLLLMLLLLITTLFQKHHEYLVNVCSKVLSMDCVIRIIAIWYNVLPELNNFQR